jgi:hypothetical protein
MNFRKPFEPAETSMELDGDIRDLSRGGAVFRQDESADNEIGVTEFGRLLHRVTGNSRREIDALIGELQTLRERLESDSKTITKRHF